MDPAADFRNTLRRLRGLTSQILLGNTASETLRRQVRFLLDKRAISDRAFLLSYAYARKPADMRDVAAIGAAVHLFDTSTMILDDILDGATRRYWKSTLHRTYGVPLTITIAELMQTRALERIHHEIMNGGFANQQAAWWLLHRVPSDLYLCQYLDVQTSGDRRIGIPQYRRVIALGAGNFYSALAHAGGLLAGKSRREVQGLRQFGYAYGMALFITDDVLDIVETPEGTGKSVGRDVAERRMRLPLILALQLANPRDARRLRSFLARERKVTARVARNIIRECGAIEASLDIARRYLQRCRQSVRQIDTPLTRGHLGWLAETLLSSQGLEHQAKKAPAASVRTRPA